LGLVLKPPKRARMNNAVAVALKGRPKGAFFFRIKPPPRIGGIGCIWRCHCFVACLVVFACNPYIGVINELIGLSNVHCPTKSHDSRV